MSMAPERRGIVFKTWQIFVFSLIPLALVSAGVIIGSIYGVDSEPEVFPPPPPAGSPTRAPGSSSWDSPLVTPSVLAFDEITPFAAERPASI